MIYKSDRFYGRSHFLKLYVIRANIGILLVLESEAARYSSELFKAYSFVQMSCVQVVSNHGVKLHYFKACLFRLGKRIKHQFLTYVKSPAVSRYRIACVAYMPSPAYIVRMKYIHTENFTRSLVLGYTAISLRHKELSARGLVKLILLRKSNAVPNHTVSNFNHFRYIPIFVFPDTDFHNFAVFPVFIIILACCAMFFNRKPQSL